MMLGLVFRGLGLEGHSLGLGLGGCDFVNITVGFFFVKFDARDILAWL